MIELSHLAAGLAGIPGVSSAVQSLEMVYRSIVKVADNEHDCIKLIERAMAIFRLVHQNMSLETTALKQAIDSTNNQLQIIYHDLGLWTDREWFSRWLHRHALSSAISEHEKSLGIIVADLQLAVTLQTHAATVKHGQAAVELCERVGALQQALGQSTPGTREHKTVENALLDIRKNKHALCLPASLTRECTKVGTLPAVTGSTYDVWEGLWLGEIPVALKFNRSFRLALDKDVNKRRFERQVDIWRILDHEFVLKLHGWYMDDDGDVFIVSPWMKNGSIRVYLEKTKLAPEVLLRLIHEIASGLKYLHDAKIFHGSLRPSNVLVQEYGHAVLSDFSMSKIISEDALVTQSSAHAMSFRFQAPETDENKPISTAGDIYSWAMTALEVVSGQMPFPRCTSLNALVAAIFGSKERPELSDHSCVTFERYPELWDLLEQCWDPVKDSRPTLEVILKRLDTLRERAH